MRNTEPISFVIHATAIRIVKITEAGPPGVFSEDISYPPVVFYLKSASDLHNVDVVVDKEFMDEYSPQVGGYHVFHRGDRHLGGRYVSAEEFKKIYRVRKDFTDTSTPT